MGRLVLSALPSLRPRCGGAGRSRLTLWTSCTWTLLRARQWRPSTRRCHLRIVEPSSKGREVTSGGSFYAVVADDGPPDPRAQRSDGGSGRGQAGHGGFRSWRTGDDRGG